MSTKGFPAITRDQRELEASGNPFDHFANAFFGKSVAIMIREERKATRQRTIWKAKAFSETLKLIQCTVVRARPGRAIVTYTAP